MTQLKQIYFKQNEKFEYEFFDDKECTKKFTFNLKKKKLYIELKNGDITPAIALDNKCPYKRIDGFTLYICGYVPFFGSQTLTLAFLGDIECDYTKYITGDYTILDLETISEKIHIRQAMDNLDIPLKDLIFPKKIMLYTNELTSKNIIEINKVAKMLKEKYGIKWVEVFTELCFIKESGYDIEIGNYDYLPNSEYVNRFLTTNATGLLEPQDEEHFTVIDCKKIFEEYIKNNQ